MKTPIYTLFLACLMLASCGKGTKEMKLTVANPSNFDRISEMVEIPISKLSSKIKLADKQTYEVKNAKGEVLPSQSTSDGKLIFQSGLKAGETANYTIGAGEKQDFAPQTYGRFVKERKDDFAWENDRVAFRVYGPALIAIDGPSNGLDIWYKRTSDLIIDKWYKNDLAGEASYHNDNGEGLDNYDVGRSLGAGAMAPYVDGKLWLNDNFVSQQLIDNGPLRTTVKLIYKDITIGENTFSESRTFALDAGSQLTKVVQEYGSSKPMTVAAGWVKRASGDSLILSPRKDYMIYLEPETDKVEGIYLGLVFPQGIDSTQVDTYTLTGVKSAKGNVFSHQLALMEFKPGVPVTYYTGYGWDKFGFSDVSDFQTYLNHFSQALKQPLIITFQ